MERQQAGKINIWNLKSDEKWSSTTIAVGYKKCALFLILFYELCCYVEH